MARRGRGGRRQGQPGQAYGNRSDLTQAPTATHAREYGDRKAQIEAQQAVPLPRAAPAPSGGGGGSVAAPAVDLSTLPQIGGPSTRPGEPVTAGLPVGPGAGPEALGIPAGPGDTEREQLLAVFRMNPTPALARLIERLG